MAEKPKRIIRLISMLVFCSVSAEAYTLTNAQGLAQHDVSVRGGSYADSAAVLNGLPLKVPYSAHFNADLPLPGHLAAAGSILPQEELLQTAATMGNAEYYSGSLAAFSSGAGAFLEGEKALRVDSDANDYERTAGGVYVQHVSGDWQIDLLGSRQTKAFGAQGYYGIPAAVYAEEKTEDHLLFFSAAKGELDDRFIRASAAWRQFDDEYRIPVSNYVSGVRSVFGALMAEGRTIEIQHIVLNLRGDLEFEGADQHNRTRAALLVLPEARFERFMLNAGLQAVRLSSESTEWLPRAGIEWFAGDNTTFYIDYAEQVIAPDFQTLYYSDPFHTANPELELRKLRNTELGLRQFLTEKLDWRAAAFHRQISNASDWTKAAAEDTAWTAVDLGRLPVFGAEAAISYYPSADLELTAFYQWIKKEDRDFFAGLYELDYPEHLLAATARWRFAPQFELFAAQALRRQADNPYRSGSDFGADASVGLHWLPRFAHNARLSFRVDNLWGSDFEALPGLKPRDTTVSSGITVQW